jgi:putative Mn2+ efflux pump MntP
LVAAWNHWIAFVLLVAIGGKMLAEGGNREKKETPHSDDDLFGPKVLFILAVATSIDALAAGLTLPMLGAPMGLSLATIGLTTAVLSAIGLFAGRLFGASLGRRLDFAGGVVLIGLGIKILVQHLRGA